MSWIVQAKEKNSPKDRMMGIGVVADIRQCISEFGSADIGNLHGDAYLTTRNKHVQVRGST